MRYLKVLCVLALCLTASPVFCIHPLAEYILGSCGFTSSCGPSPINTYEDVDKIEDIGPSFSGSGPSIGHAAINAFNVPVKDHTGQAFINKFKPLGRVLHDPGYAHFLKKYVYLEAGFTDKFGVWKSSDTKGGGGSYPVEYDPKNKPHSKTYHLCLAGGWGFIQPFDYPPDAKSCDKPHTHKFCDWDNVCEEEVKDPGPPPVVITPAKHNQVKNNIYTKLAEKTYSMLAPGPAVGENSSGIAFEMHFRDRTPPKIIGCEDGKFPELGKDKPAKTGDWYATEGLVFTDQGSEFIGTCLCLGKIDGYPEIEWIKTEDWVREEPFRVVKSGEEAQYIIMPNSCHGVMRYSLFAWDRSGLLNPGEPRIVDDSPNNCYGLSNPPPGSGDLGKDPLTAKGWPEELTVSLLNSDDLKSVEPESINPNQKRGTGYINVTDNDLPNVVIKFTSVKDRKSVFFPPVIPPLELPIFSSSEYKKDENIEEANGKDYEDFLNVPDGLVTTGDLADNLAPMYFKIIDMKPSPVMDPGEEAILEKMKSPSSEADHEFLRKNFRLEDYRESDTDLNGAAIVGDEETFGKRNGTGGEVVAVLTKPLQEDVEYVINVWTDDNVKWATKDESGTVLTNIHAIPTGIKDGSINVEIPNQLPPTTVKETINTDRAVSKDLRVVFREPTKPVGSSSESYYQDNKFPFIEVNATDFAGLTRKIKLYISVSNEKPDIRIIERQHQKQ